MRQKKGKGLPSGDSFFIPVQLPFDWQSLIAFLRLRATPGVEIITDSSYARTCGTRVSPQTVAVRYENACLRVTHSGGPGDRPDFEGRVRQMFRADADTRPIELFLQKDAWLGKFVTQQPGLRIPGGWSAFEIAVRAILGQQVSVAAATTLMGRLVRIAGTRLSESSWLFPSPAEIVKADLSGLGMPRKRLETVRSLAAFFAEQGDHCVAQPNAMDQLLAIPGIGKWTAGYILMRAGPGHDHWPEGDLVLRKALSPMKQRITPRELVNTFSQWSPCRSYAAIHIWRSYVSAPKLAAAPRKK